MECGMDQRRLKILKRPGKAFLIESSDTGSGTQRPFIFDIRLRLPAKP